MSINIEQIGIQSIQYSSILSRLTTVNIDQYWTDWDLKHSILKLQILNFETSNFEFWNFELWDFEILNFEAFEIPQSSFAVWSSRVAFGCGCVGCVLRNHNLRFRFSFLVRHLRHTSTRYRPQEEKGEKKGEKGKEREKERKEKKKGRRQKEKRLLKKGKSQARNISPDCWP